MESGPTSPLVSICCLAFNHQDYIKDTLDGFLNQKTNFSFEILIHDDASTDNTPRIIEEYVKNYPEIIKPILQVENQWTKGISPSHTYNWPRVKGKYIAMCEGDDYWTDPHHLQRSVDKLEEDLGLSLTCAAYDVLEGNKLKKGPRYKQSFEFNKEQNTNWYTKNFTLVFRNYEGHFAKLLKYKRPLDTNNVYHLLKKGNGYCFKSVIGVYRSNGLGVHSSLSEINKRRYTFETYEDLLLHNRHDRFLENELAGALILYFTASTRSLDRKAILKSLQLSFKYSGLIIKHPKSLLLLRRILSNKK